jgi:phosphatidate cytidylyltransferase
VSAPDSSAPAPVPALSKSQVFFRRFGSTIVLWSVVLWAIFSENRYIANHVFLGIMLMLALTGLLEFYGLVEKRGLVCFKWWGVAAGMLLMLSEFFYLHTATGERLRPAKANDFETSLLILFVLGLCVRQLFAKRNPAGLLAISTTLFGLMYVPWLLNSSRRSISSRASMAASTYSISFSSRSSVTWARSASVRSSTP